MGFYTGPELCRIKWFGDKVRGARLEDLITLLLAIFLTGNDDDRDVTYAFIV